MDEKRRESQILIHVSPGLRDAVHRLAREDGRSVSNFCRKLLQAYVVQAEVRRGLLEQQEPDREHLRQERAA